MSRDRRIVEGMICEADYCQRPATALAYSCKKKTVLAVCEDHADSVCDEGSPEYHVTCNNCGCHIPVN